MIEDMELLRRELDEIDGAIVRSLAERQAVVRRAAAFKVANAPAIRDPEREQALLERLRGEARRLGVDGHFVEELFRSIIDHSVRSQTERFVDERNPGRQSERIAVTFQGAEGAYSHIAARRHFGSRGAELFCRGYETFRGALAAVEQGLADYAVLPIENTTAGSINETYDLLAGGGVSLVGEEVLRVDHCLIAIEQMPVTHVRRVCSHPQAIAQCSEFLATLSDCHVESFVDTALAVRRVRDDKDLSQAAIGSEEAARLYGLEVIRRGIANQSENYTRFVVAAREPVSCDLRIPTKTSLIFATRHEKGALVRCLSALSERGLNMTKLESRPRRGNPWQYLFYVDLEGNVADPKMAEALAELGERAAYLTVLGTYPARITRDRDGEPGL